MVCYERTSGKSWRQNCMQSLWLFNDMIVCNCASPKNFLTRCMIEKNAPQRSKIELFANFWQILFIFDGIQYNLNIKKRDKFCNFFNVSERKFLDVLQGNNMWRYRFQIKVLKYSCPAQNTCKQPMTRKSPALWDDFECSTQEKTQTALSTCMYNVRRILFIHLL